MAINLKSTDGTRPSWALSRAWSALRDFGGAFEDDSLAFHITPDCILCGPQGGYKLHVANTLPQRMRAWRLTYEVYRMMGYATPNSRGLWFGPYDLHPKTITLLAEKEGQPLATMSLVFDSAQKLPADELFSSEINRFRTQGRRVFEVVSLVSREETLRGADLIKNLFKIAFTAAQYLEDSTDVFITVNPRHAAFYQNLFLFERLGDIVACPRVNNAPAVLLHIDMVAAWDLYRQKFEGKPPSRNLYRFFLNKLLELSEWLIYQRKCIDAQEYELAQFCLCERLAPNSREHANVGVGS